MFKPILPAPSPLILACCGATALLSGCVTTMPVGPTIVAMPPPGKTFELFVQDDQVCRQWAGASIGPNRNVAASQMLASTVTAATIGAIAGGLAGGSDDAGVGAGVGTVIGSGVGASQSAATGWTLQRNYDVAYQQCMYAKGNVIQGYYP